ncbi:phosphoribosylformylglycinamidine synthase subunit PurQ [uncultured Helicobacter sp.]|uniref:phosphoribosylformylglycinamidine synthase subunit PurQ n=1 Tax=uncultured Helicobacter sp. TaxID=175537 RepID=UPI00374ED84D
MSVAILQFPGTNCEMDMAYAYKLIGAPYTIVWHQEHCLPKDTKLVIVPGGFSYGDYLRSGAIARFSPIMQAVSEFAAQGGYVLGICNGFQILCEARLLPGALKRNENLHFISQNQKLCVKNTNNAFLRHYQENSIISLPIAHADGCYFIDEQSLLTLEDNGQILLTYVDNPNGSVANIAGICNEHKNVFGLMPHPERAIESILGGLDGLEMLTSLYKNATTTKHE